jgi:hypothetical protein
VEGGFSSIGVVVTSRVQEWRCDTLPYSIDIERVHELDAASRKEGRQQSINRTVYVMQGQDV